MNKFLFASILSLSLVSPVLANTVKDYTGSSFGKTFQNETPKKYSGVIEVTNMYNMKSYCFVGEKEIPCFFTDGNLVQKDSTQHKVTSFNTDIDEPNNESQDAVGYCIDYPDNTLQCSAKSKTTNLSIEFLFKK